MPFDFIEALRIVEWVEGKHERLLVGSYRHAVVITCFSRGRQEAEFSNGRHKYFSYVEILTKNNTWIKGGAGMVPVLPDGRFIMVVEQRPPQGRFDNRPRYVELNNSRVDLESIGPFSSLEFPGGAVESGESIKAGFLRELQEESGVEEQFAEVYSRTRPHYAFGSDIACEGFIFVAYLSGLNYQDQVATDGGLNVFALTREEVERNIHNGVIASGQAALLQWFFYKEVEEARLDPRVMKELLDSGYLKIETVKIIHS